MSGNALKSRHNTRLHVSGLQWEDCVAVLPVPSDPVSGPNSLLTGKIQGKAADLAGNRLMGSKFDNEISGLRRNSLC